MESGGKDGACLNSSQPPSQKNAVSDVIITRRLRDRDLLQKRKAEAQEKEMNQWVLREQRKQSKRGKRPAKGWSCKLVVEPSQEPEPGPQPSPQEEAQPVPSKPAAPEPVHQEEPPMLNIQDLIPGMQLGGVEGKLAAGREDPAGEEEVFQPAEAEIPEDLNTLLEHAYQDN
ncbi:hemogen isoform 2-T2 [Rhynochetos jubatus]